MLDQAKLIGAGCAYSSDDDRDDGDYRDDLRTQVDKDSSLISA